MILYSFLKFNLMLNNINAIKHIRKSPTLSKAEKGERREPLMKFIDRMDYNNLPCNCGLERQICPFGVTMLRRVIRNSDPRDRFVCPFLKIMLDTFPCILLGASAQIN